MTYQKHQDAIAFTDVKQAALYFDRVLPLGDVQPGAVSFALSDAVLANLLRIGDRDITLKHLRWRCSLPLHPQAEISEEHFGVGFVQNMKTIGFTEAVVIVGDQHASPMDSGCDLSVTLTGLDLVDASQASWEEICAFRMDPKAHTQLRNLRLFLFENYTGQLAGFVEDDLYRRYEAYCAAAKKHGFKLNANALTAIFDSKNIQTFGSLSVLSALTGQPGISLITAAGGLSLEIGKMALQVARDRYDLAALRENHELAYILNAKETLES